MQGNVRLVDLYMLTKINRLIIPFSSFLLGALFAGAPFSLMLVFSLAPFLCIYAAAASLNDIFDFDIDRVSNPDRPLPSKKLSTPVIFAIVVILIILGSLLSYLIGVLIGKPFFIAFVLVEIILGILYSIKLSNNFITANGTLAFTHGLIMFAVGVYLFGKFSQDIVLLGGAIWLILFLTYNIKDFKDTTGDALVRKTLPVLLGVENSKHVMFMCLAVSLPLAIFLNFALNRAFFGLILSVFLSLVLMYFGKKLELANDSKDFTTLLDHYRYVMSAYLLSFLI